MPAYRHIPKPEQPLQNIPDFMFWLSWTITAWRPIMGEGKGHLGILGRTFRNPSGGGWLGGRAGGTNTGGTFIQGLGFI